MRKRKLLQRIGCGLLAASMMAGVIGCGSTQSENASKEQEVTIEPMEAEEVYTYSFDAIGGTDVMPIVGYYGAKPIDYSWNGNDLADAFTDEYFQMLYKDTGINVVGMNHTYAETVPYLLDDLMNRAEKFGVGVIVHDRRVAGNGQGISEDVTTEMLDQYISEYSDYPAFCGNYIVDEPGYTPMQPIDGHLRTLDGYFSVFQKLDELNVFGYANLKMIRAGKQDVYPEYVARYIENCKPKMVSFDFYPFTFGRGLEAAHTYIDNISVVREEGEKAGIPFWTFLQAGDNWNDDAEFFDTKEYYPNKGELTWTASVALAMGTKGIQWFPVVQPNKFAWALSEPFDTQRNGLISIFGNKTRWYYYATEINQQIAAVDHVLMNSVNKGILVSGKNTERIVEESKTKYLLEGKSWRELKDFTGEAMVGCFNYQGKTALYVASMDVEYAQRINLDFVKNCNVTVIQNAETQHISGSNMELVLEPGNGALIVFE